MFSGAYKRYVLGTLTLVYTLHFLDRGLIALLLQPIKEDLNLSDTQLGFLTGIAFGLFYATLGVPIGRWADRGNRATITAMAIGLWGATVMSCLFVVNFIQLALVRVAAAVGEAGCHPPTYSLLGDYFPQPVERTRSMAIYMLAGPMSVLISFIVGGWLNDLYGWRITFFIMGVLGLPLAAVVKLTISEPRVQESHARDQKRKLPRMAEVVKILWQQRSFRHLSGAMILLWMMGHGLNPWYAAFMIRSHGMGTAELGIWLGLILGLGGIAGILLGGYVTSRWFGHNEQGQMRLSAVTVASLVPCFVAFLTLPQKYQALIALVPLIGVFSFFLGPTYALMQRLVVDEMRATTLALVMLLANLIGMGIGPLMVGVLSDLFMPALGTDSLRYAMLTMSLTAFWAAYHFWQVGRTVREDLLAITHQTSASTVLAEPHGQTPKLAPSG